MILVLRQIEAGLVGFACGIFTAELVSPRKQSCRWKIMRYFCFFFLSFATAGLREVYTNMLILRLITVLEIVLAESWFSKENFFKIIIRTASLYIGFTYILWACSLPFGALTFYNLQDFFDLDKQYVLITAFKIPLFAVAMYLLNEKRVKRALFKLFDNTVCQLVILSVFSLVLLCSIAVAMLQDTDMQTQSEQNRTAVLILALFFMLSVVLYFIIKMLTELKHRSRALQLQAQAVFENSEKLTIAQRENEDLITEVHRMRKNVSAATSFARLLCENDSAKLPDELFGFAGNLVSMEYDMNYAAITELRRMFIPSSSGIPALDALFTEYLALAQQNGVRFFAVCHAPLNPLTEAGVLHLNDLYRLFADLLENAFKAVFVADAPKMVSVYLGVNQNGFYEADFYDSGAPFSKAVLSRLGERGNTTGGTGNGLADILEILRYSGGSMRIESCSAVTRGYTKVIKVIFDGNGEITYK